MNVHESRVVAAAGRLATHEKGVVAMSDAVHSGPGESAAGALTTTQAIVAKIWAESLPGQDFGLDDDFIRLGGDSLVAKSVMVHICRHFGINLPTSVLFRARTIRKLSDYVETAQKTPPRTDLQPRAS